jgi:hypothetical protein
VPRDGWMGDPLLVVVMMLIMMMVFVKTAV